IAGLVPAIHALAASPKTWMPATSAGMTVNASGATNDIAPLALLSARDLGSGAGLDSAVGRELCRAPCHHHCDVHRIDAFLEFHRRVHRLSLLLDRGFLRSRQLCRRAGAARRRADGLRVGDRNALRRIL